MDRGTGANLKGKIMRAVFGLVLIAGLGLAGFAVYMVKNQFARYQHENNHLRAASGGLVNMVEVFVATKPMQYGDELKPENVRLVKWPAHIQPEGLFYKQADLFPQGGKSRVVLRSVEVNEPLTAKKVTKPGENAGITSLLEPGMRAFTIRVDDTTGVSGFLRPGHKVDIFWFGNIQGAGGMGGEMATRQEVTKLIHAGVKIIAIDQSANVDAPAAKIARTVTVMVQPSQAIGLTQAQNTGRLVLSLVGSNDNTVAAEMQIDQNALLGIKEAPKAKAPVKEQVCTIRQRRGAEVVEIPIPCTN